MHDMMTSLRVPYIICITDSMSLTQTTKYGVVLTQREERLLDYCIIPHTSLKQHKRIEPITTFFTSSGGNLDERQERLMVRDLRRALCHLRTLGADDRELIAANVVVERVIFLLSFP